MMWLQNLSAPLPRIAAAAMVAVVAAGAAANAHAAAREAPATPPVTQPAAGGSVRALGTQAINGGTRSQWRIDLRRPARLLHGWHSADATGTGEHVGGGAPAQPQPGPFSLRLDVRHEADKLVLVMGRRHGDANAGAGWDTVTTRTKVPGGAELEAEALTKDEAFPVDDVSHRTLWRGRWVRNGKVVKTVSYGVRLSRDPADGFFVRGRDPKRVVLLPGDTARSVTVMGGVVSVESPPPTRSATQPATQPAERAADGGVARPGDVLLAEIDGRLRRSQPLLTAAREPAAAVHVRRETLLSTDNTLVVKLSVVAPDVGAAETVKLNFRWRDKTSHQGSLGMLDGAGGKRRAEILIVAQVAAGTKEHPPMLMLTTQQSSGGVKRSFEAHALDADKKLSDLLTIDAEDGDHPIGKRLRIGSLGGEPIYLSVEPAPAK